MLRLVRGIFKSKWTRQRVVRYVLGLLVVLFVFALPFLISNRSGRTTSNKNEIPISNWDLLNLDRGDISEVTIKFAGDGWFEDHPFGKAEVRCTERDRLDWMAIGMDRSTIRRMAVNNSAASTGGGPYCMPYATMRVKVNGGEFNIGLARQGFILEGSFASTSNTFHSWTLAKHIDDVLFEETGKRLQKDELQGLSGQRQTIDLEKISYRKAYEEL